ncbi:MAG: hypothetical protein KGL02_08405, partial [Acidobacteriota bacterium]|nr:hypothetical protein [Acidobacteriota bacterium]
YDVMVALIVMFVLFTPRHWFHDQPRPTAHVELLSQDAGKRTTTYRVESSALAGDNRPRMVATDLMQKRAHDVLSYSVRELRGGSFQVVRVDPELANDGSVAYYDVTVRR